MAEKGKHAEASALIESEIANPRLFALPCKVVSQPANARVRFADGSIRVTPFSQDVLLHERVEMTVEHPGYEPLKIALDLTIAGDRMTLDFSRCAKACDGPLNIARSTTIAATS
jgi:N-methylhydantoinase B/oxoprolinase/acetone carboxylase alpha subunit